MAGDWIKWTRRFYEKPEVLRSARELGLPIADTVILWMRFWEWADEQTPDGWILHVTPDDIDDILRHPGFAKIGAAVGWLIFEKEGLLIPNFLRHNGRSAKERTLNKERVRAFRRKK